MNLQEIATSTRLVLVEIDGSGIEQGRTFKDKESGATKPLPGRQTAYFWQGGRYPAKASIDIPEGQSPYRPGFYFLGGEIFGAGDYDRLNFKGGRSLVLVSVDEVLDRLSLDAKPSKAA